MAGRALPRSRSNTKRARLRRTPARKRRERLLALPRPGGDVLRAHALGLAGGRDGPRLPEGPRPERRGLPRVPARPRARRHDASRARHSRRDSRARSSRAAGLTRQRGDDYFQRRLLFPLADARGRVLGFQARRLHEDDPLTAKYVNTRESELFHKGSVVYGLDHARAAIAKRRPCVRRRGQHRRDRPSAGGLPAGRRIHGDRAHRATAEGTGPADEAAVAGIRRRRRGRDRDPARNGARRAAGIRREGRPAAAGRRSCGRPRWVRSAPGQGRAVPPLSRANRDRPSRRPRRCVPHGQGAARRGDRFTRAAGRVALRERQARDDRAAPRRLSITHARQRLHHSACSTRARSSSATLSPACSRTSA